MNKTIEQRIIDRWPMWFHVGRDVRSTLMPFGFQHGDGWFQIVWGLCERLEPLVAELERETGRSFEVVEVKEKFGGLRFYVTHGDDVIYAAIEDAEEESLKTCETCGAPGTRRSDERIRTLCNRCVLAVQRG